MIHVPSRARRFLGQRLTVPATPLRPFKVQNDEFFVSAKRLGKPIIPGSLNLEQASYVYSHLANPIAPTPWGHLGRASKSLGTHVLNGWPRASAKLPRMTQDLFV